MLSQHPCALSASFWSQSEFGGCFWKESPGPGEAKREDCTPGRDRSQENGVPLHRQGRLLQRRQVVTHP